jgi:hypothetical protein
MHSKHAFKPYCSFAIRGFSEMKLKRRRRQVKGIGTMRVMKTTISVTNSKKT